MTEQELQAPWTAIKGNGDYMRIRDSVGMDFATICGYTHIDAENKGRLMAAAPELLAALRDIAATCRDNLELGPKHCEGGMFDYFLDVARTAISEAEGWQK